MAFLSSQAWSITYHSWLTFVLLLWACLIWITPFARWFCMVSSPGLVIYAELLLLVQYVYGLELTDDELPLQDPTGTFDYSELGLKKWQFPCLHLGAQVRSSTITVLVATCNPSLLYPRQDHAHYPLPLTCPALSPFQFFVFSKFPECNNISGTLTAPPVVNLKVMSEAEVKQKGNGSKRSKRACVF